MATSRSTPPGAPPPEQDPLHLSAAVREAAQHIWQAGLDVLTQARQEGGKAYQKMVDDGVQLQQRAEQAARERMAQATTQMGEAAEELRTRAAGQWDSLEGIFENRVAKALARLGVPTLKDLAAATAECRQEVAELRARVAQLEAEAQAGVPQRAASAPARPAAASAQRKPRAAAPAQPAPRKTGAARTGAKKASPRQRV